MGKRYLYKIWNSPVKNPFLKDLAYQYRYPIDEAVANEAVVTLDLAKAILDGSTIDSSLISAAGWSFDCAYDTDSYETTPGHKCPSFLLVPDVVTKDNMEEKLVTPGYYVVGSDGYLEATNG